MKRFMKSALTAALIIAMTFSLASCSGKEDEKAKVRVAYFPNITHAQALVMKNQKTLEKQWKDRADVTWTSFNAGPAEMEAIFAGEIDLGYIGPVPALSANVKSNGDVKIISNTTDAGSVLLKRKGTDIKTVKDLAGKKVAVPQIGNTQHLILLHLLEENGLKNTDQGGNVTINASSNADILNLIDNGSVDAALVPEPWGTTIEKSGNAEILLDENAVFMNGDYPVAVVVASKDFIDAHPDLVKDFLKAHEDASLYINEHAEEAQNTVNKEIKEVTGKSLASDVIRSAFKHMKINTKLNTKTILEFAKISNDEGLINKIPEESDVFATKFDS